MGVAGASSAPTRTNKDKLFPGPAAVYLHWLLFVGLPGQQRLSVCLPHPLPSLSLASTRA